MFFKWSGEKVGKIGEHICLEEIDKAGLVGYWQEKLDIHFGMTKEEALDQFREWRGTKKTCERCQGNEYKYEQYCPVRLICKEAQDGSSNSEPANLGKKLGRGARDLSVNPIRATPKRIALDKSRR